jgi:hypothetical protein
MPAGSWMSGKRTVAVVLVACTCAAALVWIVTGVLRARTDSEQIRRAIVRDAGFTPDQSRILESTLGSLDRAPGMFVNLTDYLLFESVREPSTTFWPPDVEHTGSGSPSDLLELLSRGGAISILQITDITSFDCRFTDGNNAWGTLTHGFEGVWCGRLDFKAERRGGSWVATAFRLPAEGRELRLMDSGLWMACPLETRRDGADRLAVMLDSHGVISVMRRTYEPADLRDLLTERARNSPKDSRGIPMLLLHITADPFTRFEHVHSIVMACREAHMERMRWSLRGDDLDLLLRESDQAPDAARPPDLPVVKIGWDRSPLRAFVTDKKRGQVAVGPGVVVDDPDGVAIGPRRFPPDVRDRQPREVRIEVGADVPFEWAFDAAEGCVASGVERFEFLIAE